jgi:pilus assembly protein TadC
MISLDEVSLALISLSIASIFFLLIRLILLHSKRKARAKSFAYIDANSKTIEGFAEDTFLTPTFSFTEGLLLTRYGKWLQRTSVRAGIWEQSELKALMVRKIRLALGTFIITAASVEYFTLPISFLIFTPLFAFFFPDLRLLDKARTRVANIARALPETIDLLNMCVSAGIGFHSGLQRVAASQSNPLSQEFSRVLSEMKLGQGRGAALLSLSDRLGIEPLDQFVNSILQVDRLGVPMNRVLEEQSRRLRVSRQEKAREQAQKLPVKILAPTLIFLMPALLIIVLGPAVVSVIKSFGY